MDSIEFVSKYQDYLTEIEKVIKPELQPIIQGLNEEDPHDLIRPDLWFLNESAAKGYVWNLFLKRVKKANSGV